MYKYVINGGRKLEGEVSISGAKNAAVAIVAATILCDEACVLENVPDISDTAICAKILREMGATINYTNKNTMLVDTRNIKSPKVPPELARTMRASSYFLERFWDVFVKLLYLCRGAAI